MNISFPEEVQHDSFVAEGDDELVKMAHSLLTEIREKINNHANNTAERNNPESQRQLLNVIYELADEGLAAIEDK